jgi:hypothetical protein
MVRADLLVGFEFFRGIGNQFVCTFVGTIDQASGEISGFGFVPEYDCSSRRTSF